jgi:hypothetical protein
MDGNRHRFDWMGIDPAQQVHDSVLPPQVIDEENIESACFLSVDSDRSESRESRGASMGSLPQLIRSGRTSYTVLLLKARLNPQTCDIKPRMSRSESRLVRIGAFDADAVSGLSSPASPAVSCAGSTFSFTPTGASLCLRYSASDLDQEFADPCRDGGTILLRNVVAQDGQFFEVRSVSAGAFAFSPFSAIFISRTVASVGESCLGRCCDLKFVAFEAHSFLCEIGSFTFYLCESLQSISIPPSVCLAGQRCFTTCRSLGSVTFERPSRLATIEGSAFLFCESLNRFLIPASVTAIDDFAFGGSGIRSIDIEDGSISFRVLNEFLVDFEVRSLVWVIGSPESIQIPSSIEELRPSCCRGNLRLRTVEFESDSTIRWIPQHAFSACPSLESICLPSSVEVLRGGCFRSCHGLRTVTFGAESKLRLIEGAAFERCRSVELVSVPAEVEVIVRPPIISVSRS